MASENVKISDSSDEAAAACASFVTAVLKKALLDQPHATIAVSGGSTPRLLFTYLAQADVDWSRVHFFWVDERCVPPSDGQSNFKLANEILLKPAGVRAPNIHRIHGELVPEEAAIHYIGEVENFFSLNPGELPVFDLIHRGIGPDAHTASLFPGEPLIQNHTGIAAAVWVEKMKSHRVTLLPGVLERARHTVIQAAGEDKAEPIQQVLNGPDDPMQFPCQIAVRHSDQAVWFVDRAAAQKL